jgi:hypothetical protein
MFAVGWWPNRIAQDGGKRARPERHHRPPEFVHFRIGGDRGQLGLPQRNPVARDLLLVRHRRRRTSPRSAFFAIGPVLAAGIRSAWIASRVVETGIHHHAASLLLADSSARLK